MLRILRLHILPILALALLGSLNAVRTTYASDNSSDQIIGTEQGNSGVQLQDDQDDKNTGGPAEIRFGNDVDRVRQATTTRSSALPVKFPHFINADHLSLKDSRSLNNALKPKAFDLVFLSIEDRKTLRKKE